MELGYIFLPHLLNKLRIVIQSEQAHKLQLLPVHFLKNIKKKKNKKKKTRQNVSSGVADKARHKLASAATEARVLKFWL